ncbi:MAG: hypothetical protein AB7E60_08745 [Sphingobium sp.]
MTREARSMRHPKAARQNRHIPIPHSSWTRRESASGPAARLGADDFWARLGL